MSEDQVQEIKVALERLTAALGERCAHHQAAIDENSADINSAFRKIREVREALHQQNLILAKWSGLAALGSSILTAGAVAAVKFFVG